MYSWHHDERVQSQEFGFLCIEKPGIAITIVSFGILLQSGFLLKQQEARKRCVSLFCCLKLLKKTLMKKEISHEFPRRNWVWPFKKTAWFNFWLVQPTLCSKQSINILKTLSPNFVQGRKCHFWDRRNSSNSLFRPKCGSIAKKCITIHIFWPHRSMATSSFYGRKRKRQQKYWLASRKVKSANWDFCGSIRVDIFGKKRYWLSSESHQFAFSGFSEPSTKTLWVATIDKYIYAKNSESYNLLIEVSMRERQAAVLGNRHFFCSGKNRFFYHFRIIGQSGCQYKNKKDNEPAKHFRNI